MQIGEKVDVNYFDYIRDPRCPNCKTNRLVNGYFECGARFLFRFPETLSWLNLCTVKGQDNTEQKKCTCDSISLFNCGCTCGFIERREKKLWT